MCDLQLVPPVGVSSVFDPADNDGVLFLFEAEGDAVVAAAGDAPSLELVPQGPAQSVWVGRQGGGDELDDGCRVLLG